MKKGSFSPYRFCYLLGFDNAFYNVERKGLLDVG